VGFKLGERAFLQCAREKRAVHVKAVQPRGWSSAQSGAKEKIEQEKGDPVRAEGPGKNVKKQGLYQ